MSRFGFVLPPSSDVISAESFPVKDLVFYGFLVVSGIPLVRSEGVGEGRRDESVTCSNENLGSVGRGTRGD